MRSIVMQYKYRATQVELCRWLGLPRSNLYYKASNLKRGRKPSTHTMKGDGSSVPNAQVMNTLVEQVYSHEFIRYGYRLSTEELKDMGFIINHKKAYRLMGEHGLLLERINTGRMKRNWVKWRTIKNAKPLEHICMDIKYVYIHGARRNAYLLAIMDVATRYVLGWSLRWNMKHTDVILCLHGALQGYSTNTITLRTDNGSQFIAHGLKKYLDTCGITQEFTHIATPEENAYAESLFSCVEREVIQAYQFENIFYARDVFARYFNFHNIKRKRHALGRKCPLQYWNTEFRGYAIKPPPVPASMPEQKNELLLKHENDQNVLNLFEKSVQVIGG